jgi:hypothetical protein
MAITSGSGIGGLLAGSVERGGTLGGVHTTGAIVGRGIVTP